MKKLMIFPFTYSEREIIMYKELIQGYILSATVVWNQVDLQFILSKFGKTPDVFITEEFETALKMCDAVLFINNSDTDASATIYNDYIQKAINSNKEILFLKEQQQFFDLSPLEKNGYCIAPNKDDLLKATSNYIKNIDIAAIGVMGLGDFCNKFCCEIEIASFFRKKGYKVLHFGSKNFCGILGEENYPEFIYMKQYSVTQRILKWNQYLFERCDKEKPDLIILGMPGGIMPLNNKILNDFGEIPYIISNGIRIDSGVLCSYFYEKVEQKYFTEYKNFCKYKLNCDIDCICVSNSSCRFDPDSEESILEYLHFEPDIADKMIVDANNEESVYIFNILNSTSKDKMLQNLYRELTESVSAF